MGHPEGPVPMQRERTLTGPGAPSSPVPEWSALRGASWPLGSCTVIAVRPGASPRYTARVARHEVYLALPCVLFSKARLKTQRKRVERKGWRPGKGCERRHHLL